jgi:hypothetical protein
MLTATKDLMLPATVTGSWPRPRWYDGGLWGRPLNRTVAFYKTTAIAQARNIVLKELGLEVRYVPAADPSLQVDVLPDQEPLTHLPSPWK